MCDKFKIIKGHIEIQRVNQALKNRLAGLESESQVSCWSQRPDPAVLDFHDLHRSYARRHKHTHSQARRAGGAAPRVSPNRIPNPSKVPRRWALTTDAGSGTEDFVNTRRGKEGLHALGPTQPHPVALPQSLSYRIQLLPVCTLTPRDTRGGTFWQLCKVLVCETRAYCIQVGKDGEGKNSHRSNSRASRRDVGRLSHFSAGVFYDRYFFFLLSEFKTFVLKS